MTGSAVGSVPFGSSSAVTATPSGPGRPGCGLRGTYEMWHGPSTGRSDAELCGSRGDSRRLSQARWLSGLTVRPAGTRGSTIAPALSRRAVVDANSMVAGGDANSTVAGEVGL
ncbi:hypothetical protein GCM10027161_20810 [Microbispora hainanensis]